MLKPGNFPNITPEPTSVLDIETDSKGNILDIGAAWLDQNNEIVYEVFESWAAWLDRLRAILQTADKTVRHRYTVWWAHNGGGFDWLSLLEYLFSGQYPHARLHKTYLSSSNAVIIEIKLQYGRTGYERIIKLCDSYRLLPASLNRLATEFLGEQKDEVSRDEYAEMETFKARDPERYYSYLKQDVRLLQNVILAFWRYLVDLEGSIGYLPSTLPAIALRAFRNTLPRPILTPRENRLRQLMADAYRGGRVECWQAVDTIGEQWDVNSMYPSVMIGEQYPLSYRGGWTTRYKPGTASVWRIRFRQHDTTIPPVLIFDGYQSDNAAVYGPEVDKLLEVGADVEVIEGYVFTETADIFTQFVEKYYNARMQAKQAGNTAIVYIAKLMLNSLYGKFGQKDAQASVEAYNPDAVQHHMEMGREVYILTPDIIKVVEHRQADHAFTAIAGLVTARARVKLYGLIQQAGSNYLYCDTDSVIVRGDGPYTQSQALGGVKLEAKGRVITVAKKIKWVEGRGGTLKGVSPLDASENRDDPDLYVRMLNGERVPIQFSVFPSYLEVMTGKRAACRLFVRQRTVGITN